MKILRNLLILSFTINFYSNDLNFTKDSILNFELEINKFKDSLDLTKEKKRLIKSYSLLDKNLIIENNNNVNKLYKLSTNNKIKNQIKFYDLETSGNISRGINIGNNQNSVLESELDLKIIGKLNEKVSIKASIQDSSIPIINNGYSQQLNEFDQIFIELQSEDWILRGGDIDLIKTNSFFANYEKKIQGLLLDSYLSEKINITSAAAIVKGSFTKSILNIENGNQGPYKLTGENGELYVLIVSGSESVFVNGIKIERGIDKDYIINYNAGEIIFNSTFPIMADMRIQIEYQVSEKNYNSVFGYSNIEIINKKSKYNFSYYNETDLKNQPLLQNLNNDQISILSNAGDDENLMNIPSGSLSNYNENRILYKKEIIEGIEIYVYSNNPDDELYTVRFQNVGENQGNYILSSNNAIENIYEYIIPIDGQRQGNFEPIIKITSPKKRQIAVLNSNTAFNENSELYYEIAGSNMNKNLFSSIDDEDNKGFASMIGFNKKIKIDSTSNIYSKLDLKYIDKNFETIERIFSPEFERDWGYEANSFNGQNQTLANASFGFRKSNLGSFDYTLESLKLGTLFSGQKNILRVNLSEINNLEFISSTSIMASSNIGIDSEFVRSYNSLVLDYKKIWAELGYEYEKKESNGQIITNSADFANKLFKIKTGFGNKEKTFVEIGYKKKINDSLVVDILNEVNNYDSYFVNSQIINNKKSKLNVYLNFNRLKSYVNDNEEEYLNTRIIQRQKILKNSFNSDLFFESSAGNLPQQEYTFIEVEPGMGSYKWIDINGNGIQELEEFEIAVFEDEAIFIRVLLPNQIFLRTYQNKLNYSLQTNFSIFQNSNMIFLKILSNISNKFQISLDNKSEFQGKNIILNSLFKGNDDLLAYNIGVKNSFAINRSKDKYSITYTYAENEKKNSYSFGSNEHMSRFNKINVAHKINPSTLFELITNSERKINWSENFSQKNYKIKEDLIKPKLTYFYDENNRINFSYANTSVINLIGDNETLKQQTFGTEMYFNTKKKNGAVVNFNYYNNKFDGENNSVISYTMMNGLKNGENYTWSFTLVKKLNKTLDMNVRYFGRKSPKTPSIHNASFQVRANF
ncbi:MAG: hypothetical protein CND26_04630 [Bacteroidetes bacterium MED-G13]|nr:MAG: hypothetical protein CND26_04630 [Bacteroidetes bacterium MED-G13]